MRRRSLWRPLIEDTVVTDRRCYSRRCVLFGPRNTPWPADAISSAFTAPQVHDATATIVENGGTDVDAASTIELLTCINMGSKLGGSHLFFTVLLTDSSHLDLATVNQVFELTFDPAGFRGRIFLLLSTTPNPCPNPPKNSL